MSIINSINKDLLRVEPGLMIWTLITFGLLVLILWRTAWKPIIGALDARVKKVRSDIDTAEETKNQAEQILKLHQELLSKAQADSEKIIAEGISEAEKIRSEIVEKARNEARVVIDRALQEITLEKEKAVNELKNEVVLFSTEIAAKVMQKNLESKDQQELVNKLITELNTK